MHLHICGRCRPATPVRGVGSLVAASAVFAAVVLMFTHDGWTYKLTAPTSASPLTYWRQADVAIALIVTAVVLCAVFIGYNVFSLKLSRNSLDVHLLQFKKQFRALTRQVGLSLVVVFVNRSWMLCFRALVCALIRSDLATVRSGMTPTALTGGRLQDPIIQAG